MRWSHRCWGHWRRPSCCAYRAFPRTCREGFLGGTLLPVILSTMQAALGVASGALVGFSLGLIGGGGSILAVPLMVYVVGVADAHIATGTSAIAVATNAAINLWNHARGGTVRWSCAIPFAAAGIAGALVGTIFGKLLDGRKLLVLFAQC